MSSQLACSGSDRGLFGHGDFRYNHSSERRVLERLFFSIVFFGSIEKGEGATALPIREITSIVS